MDNNLKHTAKDTKDLLRAKIGDIVQWQNQSPNLNPIARFSATDRNRPINKQQLKAAGVAPQQSMTGKDFYPRIKDNPDV